MPAPVIASPAPIATVPWAWIERRIRSAIPARAARVPGAAAGCAARTAAAGWARTGRSRGSRAVARIAGNSGDRSGIESLIVAQALQSGRWASRATQSPSAQRPVTPRPRARTLRRPPPPGPRRSPRRAASRRAAGPRPAHRRAPTSSDAMRFASTTSNGPSPLGTLPSRARIMRREAVAARVGGARLDRDRVDVDREHLGRAEPRGGDRQDPRAGAHVQHARRPRSRPLPAPITPAVGQPLQGRQAQPRRRMEPRPERHPGVEGEHHVARPAPMTPPGGPDDDPPPDPQHREVRLPGLRPVGLVDDRRAARSPIGRRPNAWRWPRSRSTRAHGRRAQPARRRAAEGAHGRAPAVRGRPARPAPRPPARTRARRWSPRGRPATGSRTPPRRPRGPRRP